MNATYLRDGYSGNKGSLNGWYRDLTVAEAREGNFRSLYATDRYGNVRNVRLNGRVKTWKRSPGCSLSLVYGLRDYFTVDARERQPHDAVGSHVRILVRVEKEFTPETPWQVVTDWVTDHELGAVNA